MPIDVTKRRVRPVLLILLWVWAGCVFLILDLFLNLSDFDSVRPRASLYRGMRMAAHKMVGEPYYDSASQSVAARGTGSKDPHARRPVENRRVRGRLLEGKKEGTWVWRHVNGTKQAREDYRSGLRHGDTTRWHANGTKQCEGSFIDGRRDGVWRWWHENGNQAAAEQYLNGRLHGKVMYWHPNGNKAEEGEYNNGALVGTQALWSEKGEREAE